MFTGIIKHNAFVKAVLEDGTNKLFTLTHQIDQNIHIDQSIAHDGVCLTVTRVGDREYDVIAVEETLSITTLNQWMVGKLVNVEFALRADSLLDGHFVQGHVDTVAICDSVEILDNNWLIQWTIPEAFSKLIVNKGSVCINGISLTSFAVDRNAFKTTIIPYTYENTNLNLVLRGTKVNIEFDILGKYFERYMKNWLENYKPQ